MYEDPLRPSPFSGRPRDWLSFLGLVARATAVLVLYFWITGSAIGLLAGCSGNDRRGDTYGDTPKAVGEANKHAAPVGLAGAGDNAPALWQLVCDLAADLTEWGAGAVVLGLAVASRAGCAGFGLNMALAGGVLLVAAFALPAYGGWALAGLVVFGGAALVGLWKTRDQAGTAVAAVPGASSLFSRLKNLFA